MSSFEVIIRPAARRDLQKLPDQIHDRIIKALESLIENPRPDGVRKLSGQENEWRIRIGDYRVLYEIDDSKSVVKIFRIAHRRESYR